MKKPMWVTVAGILGIIVGCYGIFDGAQLLATLAMMAAHEKMMSSMEEAFEGQESATSRPGPPMNPFKMFKRMLDVPEWFGTWCVVWGILVLLVSGFYLYAAIRLLQVKPSSVKLFYWAACLDVALMVAHTVVVVATMSLLGMPTLLGGVFGAVTSVVLVIIVRSGDKRVFTVPVAEEA